MATTTAVSSNIRAGQLPRYSPVGLLILSLIVTGGLFLVFLLAGMTAAYNVTGAIFFGLVLWVVVTYVASFLVEGSRRAKDRLVTALVCTAFGVALIPLLSLLVTVIARGAERFDGSFFSESMRNVTGVGGGAIHAIVGTVEITLAATVISVPIGLLAAIYLVEYGRGAIARGITFLVDVMTGIPSIVAGLFAYALFILLTGNAAYRSGFGGAVALSLLMIPIVVRSSEEMLKLVPMELREASYALGVPRWLTIGKVVLPTALAGIVTGIMLGIARIIGETAPLLLIAGFTDSMNYNLFNQQMMSLPVYAYTQLTNPGTPTDPFFDRAWTAALVLIAIVLLLNLIARLVARFFAPKLPR
ncbi:phosphate ABC transporter permease PstA [Amnibacterium setariae]|uniref:Phosphate transport system permease protein PstA n=1 Tax=Amnibacterium setariae TaxID=2306585 RepID=A0A3A1U0U1_9MICO|nr:phosphate ABC transporter permease PstA [Amnibacterium setariae]RIX30484.1 phosphate ABC transporter permease PstA [Amnibacterium setariae]